MGQFWHIICIDQYQFLPGGQLDELFFQGNEVDDLATYLAIPDPVNSSQCASFPLLTQSTISPLDKAPREVLLDILKHLDPKSCLRFALTAKRFWNLAWPHCKQSVHDMMGPWAGSKIICLGEGNRDSDMPRGLTREEKTSIKTGLCIIDDISEDEHEARARAVLRGVRPFDMTGGRHQPYSDLCSRCYRDLDKLPKDIKREVLDFEHEGPPYDDDSRRWVLRNITTREFVRADGLIAAFHEKSTPDDRSFRTGPSGEWPGLGHAALRRICWSTSASSSPCPGMNRGPWAGHRLEIRTTDQHRRLSNDEWKDVTEELIEELDDTLC